MTLSDTLAALEDAGTAQNRKIYARHGAQDPMFGVSYANQKALAKRIKRDHDLALGLWASGNHDARILATFVADPSMADDALLETWAADLDSYVITDAFSGFAAKTPQAGAAMDRWIDADHEFVEQAGWNVLASIAMRPGGPDDGFFAPYLARIERDIHGAKNRVRHSMNQALIAIGTRSDGLEAHTMAIADRIGTVEVDHGQTGCKTPEAAPYIAKARAHRRKKEARG